MAVVGLWIASALGATGTAAALVSTAVNVAISYAVAKVTQPKGPEPKAVQTEIKASNADRLRHLGKVKASGAAMFWEWKPVGKERRLYKLLAVAQGGLTAIESWWLNDRQVNVDPATGNVLEDPWNIGKVRLFWRKGRDDEPNGGDYPTLRAAAPEWTTAHKLTGVGTILGDFRAVKAEHIQETYPSGDPEISAVVLGDQCHNPWGASGWSQNLGWHLRDALTHPVYGCLTGDDLDRPSWTQSITDCQDDLALKAGGTTKRYWGGGSYRLSMPIKDVVQPMLDACGGALFVTAEGKLGLRVAKWREPNHTITADHIVRMSIRAGSGEMERVTALVPKFTSPPIGYQKTDADVWEDPVALAEVGETAPKELDLPWVQHHGQARRLAKIKLAKMNPKWTCELRLRWWGLLLMEEEMVRLDLPHLGILAEPFWIDSWGMDMESAEGPVTVRLIHASRASLEWAPAEEGEPPAVPGAVANGYTPSPLSIDAVTVVRDDGPPFIRLKVSGFDDLQGGLGRYRPQGSGIWTDMIPEGQATAPAGTLFFRTGPLEDRRQYDLNVRTTAGLFVEPAGGFAQVSGVEVFVNDTPPASPALVSASGTAGGALTVIFRPDLGVNYWRTGLYRAAPGQPFSEALPVKWNYSTAAEVTLTVAIPAGGARYWLRSQNESRVPSTTAVFVGEYT